jgi:hypothetical protein
VTVHTDASVTAYGETLLHGKLESGTHGWYECEGFCEGSHRNLAQVTMLEPTTVRRAMKEFLQHCVVQERNVVRIYTDNMVVMYTVNAWISKSPKIMADLRR